MTKAKNNVRIESDSMGPIEVEASRYWGAQTQRSLQNFDISGERQPREIIRALALVKRASAVVNQQLGLLDEKKSNAIVGAADEVLAGIDLHAHPRARAQGRAPPRTPRGGE